MASRMNTNEHERRREYIGPRMSLSTCSCSAAPWQALIADSIRGITAGWMVPISRATSLMTLSGPRASLGKAPRKIDAASRLFALRRSYTPGTLKFSGERRRMSLTVGGRRTLLCAFVCHQLPQDIGGVCWGQPAMFVDH